jgi:hypothetical protein
MNDEELANCRESTQKAATSLSQFNEQVNATSSSSSSKSSAEYESEFLSAGLWLSTVVTLALAIAFATLSSFMALLNISWNPVRDLQGVFGLYIWNGLAIALCCLTMVFWGSLHLLFISHNIAITDTLRRIAHYSSSDLASLGFSFWIIFASVACHLVSIALIYCRAKLLQRAPKPPAITVSKNDSTILVY